MKTTHASGSKSTGSVPTGSINDEAALGLVARLMAIPGKSREEAAVMAAITSELLAAGVPQSAIVHDMAHQKAPGGGQVGNMIVKLPGQIRGPRRLMMAHVDTVPICQGAKPYIDGDWFRSKDGTTGLGGDDRAGVAVVLTAVRELLTQQLPHPPLTIFFPVQEEIGLIGARYASVNKLGTPKLCFNWDGGEPNRVCLGATGDYAIDIEIEGIASHAGVHPERGVNAAAIAALAMADLIENGWHGLITKGRNAGTSNLGVISGGEATNVVMPLLKMRAEVRSHDPKFRFRIVEAYQKAFKQALKKVKASDGRTGKIRFEAELKYESFRLTANEPAVSAAIQAIEAVGLTAETCISNGGLDANWMNAHGLPTVTLGCGQHDIHTVNERLHIPTYLNACQIALNLATGLGE